MRLSLDFEPHVTLQQRREARRIGHRTIGEPSFFDRTTSCVKLLAGA